MAEYDSIFEADSSSHRSRPPADSLSDFDPRATIKEYDPAQHIPLYDDLATQRQLALRVWAKRAVLLCLLHLVNVVVFFYMKFVISNFATVMLVFAGILASRAKQKFEYAFAYLMMTILNLGKDVGLLIVYHDTSDTAYSAVLFYIACIADIVLFSPAHLYVSYYLYQTIRSSALL